MHYYERSGGNGSSAGPFRRQSGKRKKNKVLCRFAPITKGSFIDSGFCDVADLRYHFNYFHVLSSS
jgi:hypothetical protein